FSYVKNRSEAEEIVQDACVKVLLSSERLHIKDLKAYISTTVKNSALKKIRRDRQFTVLTNEDILEARSGEDSVLPQRISALKAAIAALPQPSRNVFELCVIQGYKYESAADTLGISKNTVKYHIKKAYKTLRNQMTDTHISVPLLVISLLL
ncbi:MAG: sigma-70 family RNA polymerase sigma factor, partial [Bacteroidota bacterium]